MRRNTLRYCALRELNQKNSLVRNTDGSLNTVLATIDQRRVATV
jgi:hypothetical protein